MDQNGPTVYLKVKVYAIKPNYPQEILNGAFLMHLVFKGVLAAIVNIKLNCKW
jgi:hypothetical protein